MLEREPGWDSAVVLRMTSTVALAVERLKVVVGVQESDRRSLYMLYP